MAPEVQVVLRWVTHGAGAIGPLAVKRALGPDGVRMVSNGFTIADPSDAGMLDVVGFDTAVSAVMADFVRT